MPDGKFVVQKYASVGTKEPFTAAFVVASDGHVAGNFEWLRPLPLGDRNC